MAQGKNSGGQNRGREIDLEEASRELYAARASAGVPESTPLEDLIESLDYFASVGAFFLKHKGIQEGIFTEKQFRDEFE